jgi:hypothetical protein
VPFSIILITFHTSSSHLLIFWDFQMHRTKKGVYLISWEEGDEGPEGMQPTKDKIQIITFQMLAQRDLENNEMFLLRIQRPAKPNT